MAEHQHGVLVHAGVDRRDLLTGHRLSHVDAVHFACEAGPDLADGDAHRRLLQCNGDQLAGMASVLCCFSNTTLSWRGGGQMPAATASPRMRSRSPMFL